MALKFWKEKKATKFDHKLGRERYEVDHEGSAQALLSKKS